MTAEADELAAQRLLGAASPDVDDRVALWVCVVCGDVLCGALTARVEHAGDEVVWRDFALSYHDHATATWVHEIGPFAAWDEIRFAAGSYRDSIEQRPRAVQQFPPERAGGMRRAPWDRLTRRGR